MYYIEYIPGTIARITTTPPLEPLRTNGHQCHSTDVNALSRVVGNFNHWLNADHYNELPTDKLTKLRTLINTQL